MPDDWIRVRQIRAYGYHGVFPKEQILGQIFDADVELQVDQMQAVQSDSLADSIDYVDVYQLVERILTGRSFTLIESLAGHIAEVLLQTFPATCVIIRIRKPDIDVLGQSGTVEVELQRERTIPWCDEV